MLEASIAGTCSWSRSMTAAGGTAITSSSPMCSGRALEEEPDRVPVLHRRASHWHEHDGDRAEAIRHAMAGEDFDRAASLIELAVPAMRQGHQEVTALRWLRALPDELFGRRPVLSVG